MWRPWSTAEPVATRSSRPQKGWLSHGALRGRCRLRLSRPPVIEQLDSTTVIPPGVEAEVDECLNIVMHL